MPRPSRPTQRCAKPRPTPVERPLSQREDRDFAALVGAASFPGALEEFLESDEGMHLSTDRIDTLHGVATLVRQAARDFAVGFFGALIGALVDDDAMAHARTIVTKVVPATANHLHDDGLMSRQAILRPDRVSKSCEWLATIARSEHGIEIRFPDRKPGGNWVIAYARLERRHARALDLEDVHRLITRETIALDRLAALEWDAATWWWIQYSCPPDGPAAREAFFQRLSEWYHFDREEIVSGTAPMTLGIVPPDDTNVDQLLAVTRAIRSVPGVFLVRDAGRRSVVVEELTPGGFEASPAADERRRSGTQGSFVVDEPASERRAAPGDYVFGRLMPVKPISGPAAEEPAWDFSAGTVLLAVPDETRRAALRAWVASPDPTLSAAVAVETALRIANGLPRGPVQAPPARSAEDARALFEEVSALLLEARVGLGPSEEELRDMREHPEDWPDEPHPTTLDVVMVDWLAALHELGTRG